MRPISVQQLNYDLPKLGHGDLLKPIYLSKQLNSPQTTVEIRASLLVIDVYMGTDFTTPLIITHLTFHYLWQSQPTECQSSPVGWGCIKIHACQTVSTMTQQFPNETLAQAWNTFLEDYSSLCCKDDFVHHTQLCENHADSLLFCNSVQKK